MDTELERILSQFEAETHRNQSPKMSDFVSQFPEEQRSAIVKKLISIDIAHRLKVGKAVSAESYHEFGDDAKVHAILEIVKNKSASALIEKSPPGQNIDSESVASKVANGDPNKTTVDDFRPNVKSDDPTTGFFVRQDTKQSGESASSRQKASGAASESEFRFDVRKLHAAGGLGEVFIAKDRELDRKVAFKRIRDQWVDDEIARQRFYLESYVTGNLEHPGIVPVYSAGESNDGCPYYVMRFVRGKNMKDRTIELFKNSKAGRALFYRGFEFKNMLDHFVDACNTIAYAHSKGVLHRDIKPSNIMLGKYGETLIVDWGLAKKLDQPEIFPSSLVDDVSMMSHMDERRDATITSQGSTIGTPAFMSPEQAEGNLMQMDARSDIYSLGATLYMLLTGQSPYSGTSGIDVIVQVLTGEFRKPNEVQYDVPRQLEKICLKAMSFDPSERYQDAADLATDIQRYLADEPISVHRESWLEKCARWTRKKRSTALAVAIGLVSVTILSVVSAFMINSERARTTAALDSKLAASIKTEETLQQSRAFLNRVTDSVFKNVFSPGDLNDDQKDVLVSLAAEIDKQCSDPEIPALEKGSLLSKLALIRNLLGQKTESELAISASVETLQQANRISSTPELLLQLFHTFAIKGNFQFHKKKYDEAIKDYHTAEQYLNTLDPESKSYPSERADLLVNKGASYHFVNNSAQTLVSFQAATELYQELLKNEPNPVLRFKSIKAQTNLAAHWLQEPSTRDLAIATYLDCKKSLDDLVENNSDPQFTNFANQNLNDLATAYASNMDFKQAAQYFDEAVRSQRPLVNANPLVQKYLFVLSKSLLGLGNSQTKLSDPKAEQSLSEATSNLKNLSSLNKAYESKYAESLMAIGRFYEDKDENKSQKYFELANEVRFSMIQEDGKKITEINQFLANQINYANSLRKQSLYDQAIVIYEKAIERIDRNRDQNLHPNVVFGGRYGYADCLTQLERWADAARIWQQLALNLDDPRWRTFEIQRANCLVQLGRLFEGTNIAETLVESDQARPVNIYDAACSFAIAADFMLAKQQKTDSRGNQVGWYQEKAIEGLNKAGEAGFFNEDRWRQHAAQDEELNSLRDLPEFAEFCKKYEIELK